MNFHSILMAILIGACGPNDKSKPINFQSRTVEIDTTLNKKQHELNASYEVGFYSKSSSYYWTTESDTIDFSVNATEYVKDSSLHLHMVHKNPIKFETALLLLQKALPSAKTDFYFDKLTSLYFESPIYYLDLVQRLSKEYESKFGRKNISYQQLNMFLLASSLNTQLNKFLFPLGRKVKRYGLEKFRIISKSNLHYSLPNVDVENYPEFSIDGMGLYVSLEKL